MQHSEGKILLKYLRWPAYLYNILLFCFSFFPKVLFIAASSLVPIRAFLCTLCLLH